MSSRSRREPAQRGCSDARVSASSNGVPRRADRGDLHSHEPALRTQLHRLTPTGSAGERADDAQFVQPEIRGHEEARERGHGRAHPQVHGAGLSESTMALILSYGRTPA